MRNHHEPTPRRLTHDELKAAEAGFQGRELNDPWSQAALNVYLGIRLWKMKLDQERLVGEPDRANRRRFSTAEHHHGVLG